MSLFGPTHILSPAQLGPELASIIREHVKESELAMFTAAKRCLREVILEIDKTPSVMVRTRGGSIGQPLPAPIDQGELKRSGVVGRIPSGAVLNFTAPHAEHMERGTRPHTPPKAPLQAWARRKVRSTRRAGPKKKRPRKRRIGLSRKQLGERPQKSTRFTASAMLQRQRRARRAAKRREKAALELANRAWVGIRKHGTEGRRYYARAAVRFPDIVGEEVRKRLAKLK